MASKPLPTRFAVGEKVFYCHKDFSWIVGEVKQLQVNPKPVPVPAGDPFHHQRKREHSQYWYQIASCDPLMKCSTGEVSGYVEDWNVDVYDRSIEERPVDDLLSLIHLHDAAILRTLTVRYFQDIIYTNIGVIVVAINPFNTSIPRYQDSKMGAYLAERGQKISDKLLPHSWSQAHNTYHELTTTFADQSILISGESGAGKTEAAKIVLKYLTHVSVVNGTAEQQHRAQRIATTIAACSPILEAFGNAKTVRNDNSSRFGKLLKLMFDRSTHLFSGAFTTNYLLEKSRVMTCGQHERIYHSFYLAAVSREAISDLLLAPPLQAYPSLYAGSTLDNKEFSTVEDYDTVSNAMMQVGIVDTALRSVWRTVAGILHLSRVTFAPHVDGSTEGSCVAPSATAALSHASTLWGVAQDALMDELVSTELVVMGATTRRLLPVHKAVDVRDALCKGLYSALFDWLVARCNVACDECGSGAPSTSSGMTLNIALLDIFGFERFESNSFEQLCINYANETLQQHYNWFVFTKDMELCRNEGIDTVNITCPDLQPTLQLMQGMFSILDDQCALNGSDAVFVDELSKKYHKQHPSFVKDLTKKHTFGVSHFAGLVTYAADGWIEKNRDTLKPAFHDKVFASANVRAADNHANVLSAVLLAARGEVGGEVHGGGGMRSKKKSAPLTVSSSFRAQMSALLAVIESTNPRWIRCVKPHPEKTPQKLSGPYTLRQLEFSGILGTVKIRKAGYPVRFPHRDFCVNFQAIARLPQINDCTQAQIKAHCQAILTKCSLSAPRGGSSSRSVDEASSVALPAQMGNTLVFLKSDAFYELERIRKHSTHALAVDVQRAGRGFAKRRKVWQLKMLCALQRCARGYLGNKALRRTYELVHASRIAEARRQREELEALRQADVRRRAAEAARHQRAEEERCAKALAAVALQTHAMMTNEECCRSEILAEYADGDSAKEVQERFNLLTAQRQWEAYQAFLLTKIAPLTASHAAGRTALCKEEAEGFEWIAARGQSLFRNLWIKEQLVKTRRDEMKVRAQRLAEYEDDVEFLNRFHLGALEQERYRDRKRQKERERNALREIPSEAKSPSPRREPFGDHLGRRYGTSQHRSESRGNALASLPAWGHDSVSRVQQLTVGTSVRHLPTGAVGTVLQIVAREFGHRPPVVCIDLQRRGANGDVMHRWVEGDELEAVPAFVASHASYAPTTRGSATSTSISRRSSPSLTNVRNTTASSPQLAYDDDIAPEFQGTALELWKRSRLERESQDRSQRISDSKYFRTWQQRIALLED